MPGVLKQGRVIFEVAPDSEGFTLILNDLAKPKEWMSAKFALYAVETRATLLFSK
jgi:hypothetical protein